MGAGFRRGAPLEQVPMEVEVNVVGKKQPLKIKYYEIQGTDLTGNTPIVIFSGGIKTIVTEGLVYAVKSLLTTIHGHVPTFIVWDFPGKNKQDGTFDGKTITAVLEAISRKALEPPAETTISQTTQPKLSFLAHCFGTGPTVEVAARLQEETGQVDSVMLLGSYATWEDFSGIFHVPETFSWFRPYLYAPRLTVPVFMVHGTEDRAIPIERAREFYRHFSNGNAHLVELKGLGHELLDKNSFHKTVEALSDAIGDYKATLPLTEITSMFENNDEMDPMLSEYPSYSVSEIDDYRDIKYLAEEEDVFEELD